MNQRIDIQKLVKTEGYKSSSPNKATKLLDAKKQKKSPYRFNLGNES
jgi:hypothetical protein